MPKQEDRLYLVETDKEVFWSDRKLDATYKHVQYRYGQAKFKEVEKGKYSFPSGKKKIRIDTSVLEEV